MGGIPESSCYGLACLNIGFELEDSVLLKAIADRIAKEDAPSYELSAHASRRIREEAHKYHDERYQIHSIDYAMAKVDQIKLRTLLTGIADKLVPEELCQ